MFDPRLLEIIIKAVRRAIRIQQGFSYPNKLHKKRLKRLHKMLGGRWSMKQVRKAEPFFQYKGNKLVIRLNWYDALGAGFWIGLLLFTVGMTVYLGPLGLHDLNPAEAQAGSTLFGTLSLALLPPTFYVSQPVYLAWAIEGRLQQLGKPTEL